MANAACQTSYLKCTRTAEMNVLISVINVNCLMTLINKA